MPLVTDGTLVATIDTVHTIHTTAMVYLMVSTINTEGFTLFLAKTAIDTFVFINNRTKEGETAE